MTKREKPDAPQLRFRPLVGTDMEELVGWFSDPVLARRVSRPDEAWLRYVRNDAGPARAWVGMNAGAELIGEVQVDQETPEGAGFIAFFIRPDLRGQGLGAAFLAAFLEGPGAAYPTLVAAVEEDNAASLVCCLRCGFQRSPEVDEDGLLQLVWTRNALSSPRT